MFSVLVSCLQVSHVLASLQAGNRGTQACITAASAVSGIIADLDTTIMFATAGTLHRENAETFADHRCRPPHTSQVTGAKQKKSALRAFTMERNTSPLAVLRWVHKIHALNVCDMPKKKETLIKDQKRLKLKPF